MADETYVNIEEAEDGRIVVDGNPVEGTVEFLLNQLRAVNAGPHRSREISLAITAIEEGGLWLLKDRLNRED